MTCATPPATVTHSATAACLRVELTWRVRAQLEMENDDVIDAMLEQVGGH